MLQIVQQVREAVAEVEAVAGQEACLAAFRDRLRAIPIQFDLVDSLRAFGQLVDCQALHRLVDHADDDDDLDDVDLDEEHSEAYRLLTNELEQQLARGADPRPRLSPKLLRNVSPAGVKKALSEAIDLEREETSHSIARILLGTDEFRFEHDITLSNLADDNWTQDVTREPEVRQAEKGSPMYFALFAARFLLTGLKLGTDRDKLLLLYALSRRMDGSSKEAATIARVLNLQAQPSALERALQGEVSLPYLRSADTTVSMPAGCVESGLNRAEARSHSDAGRVLRQGLEAELRRSPAIVRYVSLIHSTMTSGAAAKDVAEVIEEWGAHLFRAGYLTGSDATVLDMLRWKTAEGGAQ